MAKFDVAKLIRVDGRHVPPDGRGLSLYVRGNSALWVRQYRDPVTHKTSAKSLGSAKGPNALSLTQARLKCEEHRLNGTAPGARTIVADKTLAELVDLHIADMGTRPNGSGWRGGVEGKEAKAYRRLLKTPLAGVPVAAIDTQTIAGVLKPMPPLTADKHRGRIEAVLDRATSLGLRSGENPASKSVLKTLLTPPPKATPHPALPWTNVPALMKELATIDAPASRTLRFTILTGARTNEARGAKWKEIEGDIWTVPAGRHKEDKEHIVPLVPAALALLGDRGEPDDLIFGVMGTNAMLDLAKKLVAKLWPGLKVVVHGFRSTLSTWAAEQGYPDELAEMALSHAVGDAVQRAYQRSTRVNARRELMKAWADFATA